MCFLTFFLLFALLAALASAVPAAVSQAAPTVPPAGGVSLVSLEVTLDGSSGCRPGTVSALLASDYSAITLLFDQFSAADGPKAGNAKKRAFCRVSIGMAAPGWAFDVTSADFRGYVLLEKGVNATIESRWKWVLDGQDLKGKGNIQKIVQGPFEEDFLLHKDGESSVSEGTICQRKDAKIQISLSATVDAGTSGKNGYVQGSSADAAFGQILNISWKKC
ncbi:uncharacterized protein SETTUDRAFT_35612 [Exserohilum turcica Et28A]|uniref:Uncharacterized protein n=1 Tax=Exserohilum turcicum (strain 28A) TaxID=671987 RepID=R0I4V3_EXST2|nr:uncharacterized protein SETTUDRAFT_35612 [Exserohilum turcica Et28A]EOA80685.1 hypothetical protein SETTUDRAFT_35612 [Exserohilum turcica Et28A]